MAAHETQPLNIQDISEYRCSPVDSLHPAMEGRFIFMILVSTMHLNFFPLLYHSPHLSPTAALPTASGLFFFFS